MTVGGVTVSPSTLQEDIEVFPNGIGGKLIYQENEIWSSGPLAGPGTFIALKFTDISEDLAKLEVGLDPSEGTGLVDVLPDPDKNLVAKVTDKDTQNFVVKATYKSGQVVQHNWYLGNLEIVGAPEDED